MREKLPYILPSFTCLLGTLIICVADGKSAVVYAAPHHLMANGKVLPQRE